MHRHLLALTTLVLALVGLAAPAHAADRDCGDFGSQAAAQRFFIDAGGPRSDPHALDADGDGIACETLPCPCSTYQGGSTEPAPSTPTRIRQYAKVTRIIDGDTFDARLVSNGNVRRVRMLGIDTPERDRCGYAKATQSLAGLIRVGTRVKLVSDVTQSREDRYGRILRYVTHTGNGRDVNRAQVYRGWAKVFVYANDPFERVSSYRSAQYDARQEPRGIWRYCR